MFTFIRDFLGRLVGYLEFLGFRYPVKYYVNQVDQRLYRGSRQNKEELLKLKKMGIKSIVNLCAETNKDEFTCIELGLNYLHIPVIDNAKPKKEQIIQFIKFINYNNNSPVFVHCEAGIGRTGVFVACYRIHMGWTVEDALAEALTYGKLVSSQINFIRNFHR
jgi:protein tyrosine/serine phosphatase